MLVGFWCCNQYQRSVLKKHRVRRAFPNYKEVRMALTRFPVDWQLMLKIITLGLRQCMLCMHVKVLELWWILFDREGREGPGPAPGVKRAWALGVGP